VFTLFETVRPREFDFIFTQDTREKLRLIFNHVEIECRQNESKILSPYKLNMPSASGSPCLNNKPPPTPSLLIFQWFGVNFSCVKKNIDVQERIFIYRFIYSAYKINKLCNFYNIKERIFAKVI
jgi:hypothetical protein